jgi:hypothetical protein
MEISLRDVGFGIKKKSLFYNIDIFSLQIKVSTSIDYLLIKTNCSFLMHVHPIKTNWIRTQMIFLIFKIRGQKIVVKRLVQADEQTKHILLVNNISNVKRMYQF